MLFKDRSRGSIVLTDRMSEPNMESDYVDYLVYILQVSCRKVARRGVRKEVTSCL